MSLLSKKRRMSVTKENPVVKKVAERTSTTLLHSSDKGSHVIASPDLSPTSEDNCNDNQLKEAT